MAKDARVMKIREKFTVRFKHSVLVVRVVRRKNKNTNKIRQRKKKHQQPSNVLLIARTGCLFFRAFRYNLIVLPNTL